MPTNINVQVIDMEYGIYEQVVLTADDWYTIFLNARYDQETQIASYWHAIAHILNDDFYSEEDVQSIEAAAHQERRNYEGC